MKEIKFKAWDRQAKRMRLVKSIGYADDGFAKTVTVRLVGGEINLYVNSESCELVQYTGVKDKNGEEIYVGDIITNTCGNNFQVIWGDMQWAICNEENYYIGWVPERTEIIGNIYANSNLLELA